MQLADGIAPADVERWVPAASLLHSNGDAMDIAVRGGQIVGVRGREHDRVNRRRLGPKDLFAWQANGSPDRLTTPSLAGKPVGGDDAMDAVVGRCRELLDRHGPSSIAFYTSGQLFLEEYWTPATIARAGIGTNHLDGNTRLCTATAGEALKESFGADGQPGSYDDHRVGRRRPARRDVGREDGNVHQCRSNSASQRAGERTAGRGPKRPGDLHGLRGTDGTSRPRRGAAGLLDHAGRGLPRVAGVLARTTV
jgi:hypothetical protein